jgi:hypothetical protein
MTELFVGLPCFILGMIVMYIFCSQEHKKLEELCEKTYKSTFDSIFEIFKMVMKDKEKDQ